MAPSLARNELAKPYRRELAAARAEHDDRSTRGDMFDRGGEALAADRLGDQRKRPLGQFDRLDDLPGAQIAKVIVMPG